MEKNSELESEIEIRPASVDSRWSQRFRQAHDDRVVLSRFLAGCLVAVAMVNVAPAILYWNVLDSTDSLPRWIYLQIFAGLLHVVYAIFLIQIPDWATLRSVSWAMLAVAMSFGLLSTGLTVGDDTGLIPRFLGLTPDLVGRAGLWCVAMLCVATLVSYLGGRESSRWQRAEKLLFGMHQRDQNE